MIQSKNMFHRHAALILLLFFALVFSGCGKMMTIFGHQSPGDSFLENRAQITIEDLDNFKAGLKPVNGEIKAKYLLARHFQKLNRHLNAIEELNEAIRIEPCFPEAYNALGVSYDSLGKFAMAEECYKMALRLNGDLPYVVNNLGYSYMMRGENEKARQFLEMAITMEENNVRYRNNLLLAYQAAGIAKNGQEEPIFKSVSKTNPEENQPLNILKTSGPLKPEPLNAETFQDVEIVKHDPEEMKNIETGVAENPHRIILTASVEPSQINTKDDRNIGSRFYKVSPPSLIEYRGLGEEKIAVSVTMVTNEGSSRENKKIRNHKPSSQVLPDPVEVELFNGNGINGFAKKMGHYLREKGYRIRSLKNADHFNYNETKIYFHENLRENAWQLAGQLPGELVISKTNMIDHQEKNIRVLLGKDLANPGRERADQRYQIEISNGNGVNGAARRMAEYLRGMGFPVNRLSNADHFNYSVTHIFFGKDHLSHAQALLEILPEGHRASIVEMGQDTKKIRLLIGKDVVVR